MKGILIGQVCSCVFILQAARRIDEWYADNGIFGGVKEDINMRKKSLTTGEYIFEVEELEVGDVRLRFVDKKGNEMQVCIAHAVCSQSRTDIATNASGTLPDSMHCTDRNFDLAPTV